MYNGIGLRTARGSGTNGYVTKNYAHVKEGARKVNQGAPTFDHVSKLEVKKANPNILLHEQKRKIESQLFDMRLRLEEKGSYSEEQIEQMIDKERQELLKKLEREQSKPKHNSKYQVAKDREYYQNDKSGVESHEHVEARNRKNELLAKALGIDAQNHIEGEAFNKEAQEKKKQEKIQKREEMLKQKLAEKEKELAEKPKSPSPVKSPEKSPEPIKRKRSRSPSSEEDHKRKKRRRHSSTSSQE